MRIASILTLAGVLSAGSAAAVINSQAFTDAEANADAAAAASGAVTATATQVYSTALTETQLMYQVGDAGFVTLDTAGNVLTVVSVTVNPGWEEVDTIKGSLEGAIDRAKASIDDALEARPEGQLNGAADVAVAFQQGDLVLEFTAGLLADGAVVTAVDPNPSGVLDANGTAGGEANAGTGNGGSDTDDSGVLDANGTADAEASGCTGDLITVCADADADADVRMNDD